MPEPRRAAGLDGLVRIATRASALALAQSRIVEAGLLAAWPGLEVALVGVVTEGDRRRDLSAAQLGGKGVFTAAVQQAVLEGRADLAVHSAKDLPAAQTPGLALAAVPEREDPRDVLVTAATAAGGSGGLSEVARSRALAGLRSDEGATREASALSGGGPPSVSVRDPLDSLPTGSRVGTGSPRRVALLSWLRPDLEVRPLRGNVDTRVGKVVAGELDAAVLAASGLRRLGLAAATAGFLDPEVFTPAPGQGCLAVEAREDDQRVLALLAGLTHERSRTALAGERAFLARLGGSCTLPAGALLTIMADGSLELRGFVAALDGKGLVRERLTGPAGDPEGLGRALADHLLAACGPEVREVIEANARQDR
ncbi:MAG TPA: hydroxymethylbilane synthase [Actinomycetota bacterium]|nr:hydroxymethylbilane synthase [Actinomycetota bacterium]